MKLSEAYRMAAKLIEDDVHTHSCNAIRAITGARVAGLNYCALYGPDAFSNGGRGSPTWIPAAAFDHDLRNRRRFVGYGKGARILALCFAAAIAESEGK